MDDKTNIQHQHKQNKQTFLFIFQSDILKLADRVIYELCCIVTKEVDIV